MRKALNIICIAAFLFILQSWDIIYGPHYAASIKPPREFEGVITYTTIAESKTADFSNSDLQKVYGNIMTLYYKNGNYKMEFNGNEVKAIYYLGDKNAQFTVRYGIDTLFVSACENEVRTLVSSTYTSKAEKILKRNCDLVVNDLGDSQNYYWFDPAVYVNPDHFKKHVFGFVNVYFEKAKAFWIKHTYDHVLFKVTHTAIKIKKQKVNDSVFELPKFPEKRFH